MEALHGHAGGKLLDGGKMNLDGSCAGVDPPFLLFVQRA
jgi:hypothetical protein